MKLIIKIPDEDYKYICKIANDLKGRAVLPTDWKAIVNGTPYNPSGDLISREALKEAMNEEALNLSNGGRIFIENINKIIDNAQAIPLPSNQIAWEQGYEAGLAQGKQDNAPTVQPLIKPIAEIKVEARPQGEWIIVTDKYGKNVKCPFCGKEIAGSDLNYCVKCGADMRKGGAEE